jgi:predicted methyltransferase
VRLSNAVFWSALALSGAAVAAPTAAPPAVVAAVSSSDRPPGDVARDANRKPSETLAFAGIKPGDRVADFVANSGYFTRLLSGVAGPAGHVYAVELQEIVGDPDQAKGANALKAWTSGHPNTTMTTVGASQPLQFPEKLDLFWISQNYHDLHDKFLGPVDVAAFNRQVFAALRPGGLYVILDHRAAPGARADVTEKLHRIDPETVKREVEAAGFELVAESAVLANPADPLTVGMWDKSVKGHTDQFLLKFRRPVRS